MDQDRENKSEGIEREINDAHVLTPVEMSSIMMAEHTRGYYRGHYDGVIHAVYAVFAGALMFCIATAVFRVYESE